MSEIQMPHLCPGCQQPSAVVAKPHCKSKVCGWLQCRCGTTYDSRGNHSNLIGRDGRG